MLRSILHRIKCAEEVILHDGEIDYANRDDVSSHRFLRAFKPVENVICCPTVEPLEADEDFPWFIGVEPIEYKARFEAALKSKWGSFKIENLSKYVVGTVENVEILRDVFRYVKI